VVSVLVLPFITEFLTPEDYGIYGIITAYMASLVAFSILGMNVVFYNSYIKHPYHFKKIWNQLYGFLILWALIYALIQFLFLYFLIPEEAAHNKYIILFLLIVPTVFFGPISSIAMLYYQVKEKPSPITIRSIASALIVIFLNVVFIRYYKMGYMGWFYATFISTMLWNASYWYPMYKKGFRPNFKFKKRLIKKSLKVSLPTIVHYYGGFLLGTSNKLVMENVGVKISEIGQYDFAARIAGYGDAISIAMGQALGPMIAKEYKNNKQHIALLLIRIMQITIFTLTFLISIWSKEIVDILMKNPSLKDCYYIVIILLMSYNYKPMYIASTSVVFYLEKTHKLWKISFIAGLISIGLNFIIIPEYGIFGAAIVYFISTTYIGYSGFFISNFKLFSKQNYKYYTTFSVILVATVSAYFLVDQNILVKIMTTSLTSIISLYLLRKYYFLINREIVI
ncbi:MAG: lipopolysaccharide biosynthesis protein, partial [Flavobacteriales bacterium]